MPPGPGGFQPPPGYQPLPGYQPFGGQPMAQQPGTSGMAIASLVCSIVGIFLCGTTSILGVIFGFIGLSQTKDNVRPGRGLAIAGLVIGIIVVLLWGVFWAAAATSKNGCVHFGSGPSSC